MRVDTTSLYLATKATLTINIAGKKLTKSTERSLIIGE